MRLYIKSLQPALILLLFHAFGASADEVVNKAYWICKNKKEVRTIRVQIDSQTKECSTFYSKLGSEKVVGSGKWHESCMNYLSNIRTNLEKSDWNCRDISSAKITGTTE